jgi:hypothetical protein
MKHLYKKVAELESGLLKLLSGSLITPAAAASLIASLNKIAASGVVKSLSSGGGAPGNSTENKLVETIQKAAMAAAAASSGGGAPPFAVALGRLANSMGGRKSIGGSLRQQSSRGGSSLAGLRMGRRTGSGHAEGSTEHGKQHLLAKVRATACFAAECGCPAASVSRNVAVECQQYSAVNNTCLLWSLGITSTCHSSV